MTSSADRYLELAAKIANRLHVMTGVGPAIYSISGAEYAEIATALRRLAEIEKSAPVATLHNRPDGYAATIHTEQVSDDDFDVPLYRLPKPNEVIEQGTQPGLAD